MNKNCASMRAGGWAAMAAICTPQCRPARLAVACLLYLLYDGSQLLLKLLSAVYSATVTVTIHVPAYVTWTACVVCHVLCVWRAYHHHVSYAMHHVLVASGLCARLLCVLVLKKDKVLKISSDSDWAEGVSISNQSVSQYAYQYQY